MTGVFNDETRTVINRWQAARGYPVSGYFNKLQHRALLSEPVAVATPSASLPTKQPVRRRTTASAQRQALPPPPPVQRGPDPAGAAFMGAVVGGMMGNAFRR
jgi:peptidoglycan hydrolase-like protein with peptidoglycan-binding domain